ncbi:MAG: hypothetical protein RLZZ397_82 [Pseudomonadota bacterium]|jgi:cytochrome c-type biogenesis protein CcmE
MTPRQKRLWMVVGGLAALGVASALVLNALNSNIALYITPTEVQQGKAPKDQTFRVGGLVQGGSLQRVGTDVHFVVTDTANEIPVTYTGILPDLFMEGKGAVVQGRMQPNGQFVATEVLAKHDENYMPPEAADAVAKGQQHMQGTVSK